MVRLGSRRRCARKTVRRLLCRVKPEYADECGYLRKKTFRTCPPIRRMSVIGSDPDVTRTCRYVAFWQHKADAG